MIVEKKARPVTRRGNRDPAASHARRCEGSTKLVARTTTRAAGRSRDWFIGIQAIFGGPTTLHDARYSLNGDAMKSPERTRSSSPTSTHRRIGVPGMDVGSSSWSDSDVVAGCLRPSSSASAIVSGAVDASETVSIGSSKDSIRKYDDMTRTIANRMPLTARRLVVLIQVRRLKVPQRSIAFDERIGVIRSLPSQTVSLPSIVITVRPRESTSSTVTPLGPPDLPVTSQYGVLFAPVRDLLQTSIPATVSVFVSLGVRTHDTLSNLKSPPIPERVALVRA